MGGGGVPDRLAEDAKEVAIGRQRYLFDNPELEELAQAVADARAGKHLDAAESQALLDRLNRQMAGGVLGEHLLDPAPTPTPITGAGAPGGSGVPAPAHEVPAPAPGRAAPRHEEEEETPGAPVTRADADYLARVARFKGVAIEDVVAFYSGMEALGIDHEALVERALAKYPTLSRAEADAIFGYTTKLFYRDLNRTLEGGGTPEAQELTDLIKAGLESMPQAAPTQHRGLRLGSPAAIAAFDAEYTMDAVIETKSFWSTGPSAEDAYGGSRKLIILTSSARDIGDLAFGVHFHDRVGKPRYSSEAVIPPGVRFRVVRVDPTTGTVTLQEIP
jgi:hypothetical protein